MREKAFNLFTALVSFVLIVLALILVQNMMRTERNTVDIIKSIEEQAEMQAIADLRRADAMQVFNYGVRWQISDYLIGNTFTFRPEQRTWKELQDDFAMAHFSAGGRFAIFTATVISSILGSGDVNSSFGAYSIAIVSASEGERDCRWDSVTDTEVCTDVKALSSWEIAQILQKSVNNSIANNEFFQVVECPDGKPDTCTIGTFYVMLDIKSLTNEEYEMLPQILVVNENTGRRIKEPILPRGKFRIFIPLRLFKAIAIARSIAFTDEDESRNQGLFSARVHNEIEQMKLGMCDAKSCVPRTDPYNTADASAITDEEYCPGDTRDADGYQVNFNCTGYSSSLHLCDGMSAYNMSSSSTQSLTENLQRLAKRRVCKLVEGLYMPLEWNGLRVIGNADACDVGAELTVTPVARASKIILMETASGGGTASSGFSHVPYSQCQAPSAGGFYTDAGTIKPFMHTITNSGISVTPGNLYASASCAEVNLVQMTLKIRETNPAYMVNKDPSEYTEFNIMLSDDEYTPFTARLSTPGVDASTCALESAPVEIPVEEKEWTCHSREETGGLSGSDPTIGPKGCYPEAP